MAPGESLFAHIAHAVHALDGGDKDVLHDAAERDYAVSAAAVGHAEVHHGEGVVVDAVDRRRVHIVGEVDGVHRALYVALRLFHIDSKVECGDYHREIGVGCGL